MFGDILGAIGSFASGFMNRSAVASQQKALGHLNTHKIRMTVNDARKAGIHPLAALGSPVAGSWASPVANTALGDAVGEGAARLGSAIDRGTVNELQRLQMDTERARIRNLDANTAATLADAQSRTAIASARRSGQSLDTRDVATTTDPRSVMLGADPSWPDAQKYENRYGELSDFIFGPAIAWSDFKRGPMAEASGRFERRREKWHGVPYGPR